MMKKALSLIVVIVVLMSTVAYAEQIRPSGLVIDSKAIGEDGVLPITLDRAMFFEIAASADGKHAYGKLEVEHDLFQARFTVFEDERVMLAADTKTDSIVSQYPDVALEFLNIVVQTSEESRIQLLLMYEKDQYIYEVKSGALHPTELKWSEEEYGFVGTISASTSFAVSNVKLELP